MKIHTSVPDVQYHFPSMPTWVQIAKIGTYPLVGQPFIRNITNVVV